MELLASILIWGLVVFRIADDITNSSGPFDAFIHFRTFFMTHEYPAWVVEGINCRICVSFWFSLILVSWHWDIRYLAVAGLTSVITRWLED